MSIAEIEKKSGVDGKNSSTHGSSGWMGDNCGNLCREDDNFPFPTFHSFPPHYLRIS
jgi:hypothetical protein